MRMSVLLGAFLLAILFGAPLNAAGPADPQEEVFRPKLDMYAVGLEKENGELTIFVALSQREIVQEDEGTFEYIYTMYFYDHIFDDGKICIAVSGGFGAPACTLLSTLQKAPAQEAQNTARMLQKHFEKVYEKEVKPDVEAELRKRLKELPPATPSRPAENWPQEITHTT